MQRPVSSELKRKERRGSVLYGGMLATILLLMLGGAAWLVWAGVLFPQVAGPASLPAPRHVVRPTPGLRAEDFNRLLGGRLSEAIQRKEGPPYVVRFREEELSALLLAIAPDVTSQGFLRLSSGQMASDVGELEASFVVDAPPFHFPWRIRVEPSAQTGVLHLEIQDARLGRINLLPRLVPGLLGMFLRYDPRDINLRLGEYALVRARAADRSLELFFE